MPFTRSRRCRSTVWRMGTKRNGTTFAPGHKRSPESIEKQRQTMREQYASGERAKPPGRKPGRNRPVTITCQNCGKDDECTSSRQRWCKTCVPNMDARSILFRYGLFWPEWLELLANQRNACAICFEDMDPENGRNRIYVDHDHVTGKVRGLLCPPCNTLLRALERPSWRASAEAYLKGESHSFL